jgi:hypothetical protein
MHVQVFHDSGGKVAQGAQASSRQAEIAVVEVTELAIKARFDLSRRGRSADPFICDTVFAAI